MGLAVRVVQQPKPDCQRQHGADQRLPEPIGRQEPRREYGRAEHGEGEWQQSKPGLRRAEVQAFRGLQKQIEEEQDTDLPEPVDYHARGRGDIIGIPEKSKIYDRLLSAQLPDDESRRAGCGHGQPD